MTSTIECVPIIVYKSREWYITNEGRRFLEDASIDGQKTIGVIGLEGSDNGSALDALMGRLERLSCQEFQRNLIGISGQRVETEEGILFLVESHGLRWTRKKTSIFDQLISLILMIPSVLLVNTYDQMNRSTIKLLQCIQHQAKLLSDRHPQVFQLIRVNGPIGSEQRKHMKTINGHPNQFFLPLPIFDKEAPRLANDHPYVSHERYDVSFTQEAICFKARLWEKIRWPTLARCKGKNQSS
jgi:hypothetical protein